MMGRLKAWLDETHGIFFELVRHFFARLFDTDLVTAPDQLRNMIIGVLAAICSFALYTPIAIVRKYVDLTTLGNAVLFNEHAIADRLMYTMVPMVLVAFVTALQWQSLFPTERDYLILMPLPISRVRMFAAKLCALGLFIGLFVLAINLFPSITLPMVQESKLSLTHWGPDKSFSHAFAISAGAFFVFFSLVSLQGLLMNLLGRRLFPRVSLLLQSTLLLAVLTALPQVLTVTGMYRRGDISADVARMVPVFWFHGLYELMIGRPEPLFFELAMRALAGLVISVLAAIGLYAITYYRQAGMQAETRDRLPFAGIEALLRRLLRMMRRPEDHVAILSFVLKTLARSRQHKLLLSVYLGVGTAILLNLFLMDLLFPPSFRGADWRQSELLHTALSAPLVMAFFFLSGVRVVFSIPVTLKANWIFQLLEPGERVRWLDAVEMAFYLLGLLPVLLSAPLFLVPITGWGPLAEHLVICTLLTSILVEIMLWEWQKIPFVCSYLPGKRNVALTVIVYWIAFGFYAFTTTRIEAWSLREFSRFLIVSGFLLGIYGKVRELRREHWGGLPLKFDEQADPVVETLGLSAANT